MCILLHFFVWVEFEFLILFITIFSLGLYKRLFLVMIHIKFNWLSCTPKHTCFKGFFLVVMGHFGWPISKNNLNPTPLPLPKQMTCFDTLLHGSVKSYKFTHTCLVFYTYINVNRPYTLTFTSSVNKLYYDIYTYTKCTF